MYWFVLERFWGDLRCHWCIVYPCPQINSSTCQSTPQRKLGRFVSLNLIQYAMLLNVYNSKPVYLRQWHNLFHSLYFHGWHQRLYESSSLCLAACFMNSTMLCLSVSTTALCLCLRSLACTTIPLPPPPLYPSRTRTWPHVLNRRYYFSSINCLSCHSL